MPIILNDDNSVSTLDVKGNAKDLKNYSPKFFHKNILTGTGGNSRGLLNEARDPKNMKHGYPTKLDPEMVAGDTTNQNIKIYNIPVFLIQPSLWTYIEKFNRPNTNEMTLIAEKGNEKIYLTAPLHAVQIEEISVPGPNNTFTKEKDMSACMHMFLFSVKDENNEEHLAVNNIARLGSVSDNTFFRCIVYNLFESLNVVKGALMQDGYNVNIDAIDTFVDNYSIYTELCKASKKWQTESAYFIADVLVKNIKNFTNNMMNYIWTMDTKSVADAVARIEAYNIPLDQYQMMYDKIKSLVIPDILSAICRFNLNLKLTNTLNHMNQNRNLLQYCPCNKHVQTRIPYSTEQRNAIESTSPLTLVQSGAGTGKSTVILGRINHMLANGIKPEDITVLSFTNAAADHITDEVAKLAKSVNANVHSMTTAKMMHTIYTNNYPTHQLSSISTIMNSLDIYFASNNPNVTPAQTRFVPAFGQILKDLRDENAYTRATNFIEDHLDETIEILDIIGQTSLELESIICYLKMDTLVEPPEVQTKHLIIDEVQDNSIAEFIYAIKYTDKHQCSMYIVGDCSQTLYEFRFANPKVLNTLESSGVFATYKLQTNYRSNQEILDFANVLLGNIEANRYANIRLRANSLVPVTLDTFSTAVKFSHHRLTSRSNDEVSSAIQNSISTDMHSYIETILNRPKNRLAYTNGSGDADELWCPTNATANVLITDTPVAHAKSTPKPITTPVSSYPMTTGGISTSKTTLARGEEFEVYINIPATTATINTFGISVEYDKETFQLVSWNSNIVGVTDRSGNGFFSAKTELPYSIDMSSGRILTAVLKVKDDAPKRNCSIRLTQGVPQIAFLAPNNRQLGWLETHLRTCYPNSKIVSLRVPPSYDNTLFSKFIAKYWDTIKFTPPQRIIETIENEMNAKVAFIKPLKFDVQGALNDIQTRISKFRAKYDDCIDSWEKDAIIGVMSQDELLMRTRQAMIEFEIQNNAIAQSMRSARSENAKNNDDISKANFILSTIHSAKGLEFDNVVVYYMYRRDSETEEEYKRKYYVAFTRAKESEYIYAIEDRANPKVKSDYEKIINQLAAKEKKLQGVTDDDDIAPSGDNSNIIMSASNSAMPLPESVTKPMTFDDTIPEELGGEPNEKPTTPVNGRDTA